jgi:hypothetical protein
MASILLLAIYNWPMNVLTLGRWEREKQKRWEEFQSAADFTIWPFATKTEFTIALAKPKLLAGLSLEAP